MRLGLASLFRVGVTYGVCLFAGCAGWSTRAAAQVPVAPLQSTPSPASEPINGPTPVAETPSPAVEPSTRPTSVAEAPSSALEPSSEQTPIPEAPSSAAEASLATPVPTTPNAQEQDETSQLVRLATSQGCEYQSSLRYQEDWYVACGRSGLLVFHRQKASTGTLFFLGDLAFSLERRSYPGASVVGLKRAESGVLALVRQLSDLNDAASQLGGPDAFRSDEPSSSQPRLVGKVVEVDDLVVQVDLGHRQGIRDFDQIAFEDVRVVGRVIRVSDESCWVRLGMGESLPVVGASAVKTRRPPTRRLAFLKNTPHRAGLSLSGKMGGSFEDGRLMGLGAFEGYLQFDALRLGVRSGPVGGGGGTFVYQVTGNIGVQHTIGALDVSFGSMKVNSVWGYPIGRGIVFGPQGRIGSEDGLHFSSRLMLAINYQRLTIGELSGAIQVPIYQGIWLIARGGGGTAGLAFFDMGFRFLVDGTGGPRSSFFQIFGGPFVLFRQELDSADSFEFSSDLGGPSLGMKWEVRL